ncbi:MAG: peptidase M4 family protein [Gammaproteobacteria bacterium]|nr:peptidase M4 family protein [Gammaproteobacteria bacterium]
MFEKYNIKVLRLTSFICTSCLFVSQLSFSATELILNNQPITNFSREYKLNIVKTVTLPSGEVKHRIRQYFKNIPVWNASIVSEDNNSFSGNLFLNIENDLSDMQTKISENQALTIAKNSLNISKETDILDKKINLFVKTDASNIAELVYIINFFIDNVDNPGRPYFIINANSGEIIEKWDGLTSLDYKEAEGPGGNKKTGKYYFGRDYNLLQITKTKEKCEMKSEHVQTYDKRHKSGYNTNGAILHQFKCSEDSTPENTYKEINEAYSPINDAHYFGEVVFQMYKDWFNVQPLNSTLKLFPHFGKKHENAYWTGSIMLFGDGNTRFYPLVSLDVIAHEVSHGFTEQNSGLIYRGQTGGINESFSDISGEAAKYFMNSKKPKTERNDWMVGASIFKGDGALRYFADPTKDGDSIDNAKDYDNSVDVHHSSGVFNKAFYLLANRDNWTLPKAYRTFVIANQLYWTENADFNKAACGITKAAKSLKYSQKDIIEVFAEVGVDAKCEKT